MKKLRCPKCDSENVESDRETSPQINIHGCLDCGYEWSIPKQKGE